MSEEKDLVKRRASYKGRLTVFTNYLQSLAKPINTSVARELQMRIGKLELLYEQYDEVQHQLECLVDNMQTQLSERAEFESLYYKVLCDAQGLLDDFNKTMDDCQNSEKYSITSNRKLVKLPTIQLPKFSGSYDNWLEFHDTFSSLIHSNDEMDNINKFHYLRASLEGSAAVVIQSIEFSALNYAVAWKLLCERYNNKRLLIQNHVSALFNIESITKESSYNLKHLIDQINKNLRALESLGEPVKQWDTLLIYIITKKLDRLTYREWEEFKGHLSKDSCLTFDTFLQFLRNRADLIETLELSQNNQSISHGKPKLKSMVAQSSFNSSVENSLKSCRKCKGDHNLNNCPQFLALTNEARLRALPSLKVCFNCFRAGHFANACKKPGCKICKRRHNTLVHTTEGRSIVDASAKIVSSAKGTSLSTTTQSCATTSKSENNNVALSANVVSTQRASQNGEILLSTALVKLCDINNREHVIRAVLDSGSTTCLITSNICNKLNIQTSKIDKSILGINNVTTHVGKICNVTMKSLDDSFSAHIHCYVLPSITSNIPGREVDIAGLKIPSNINLADPTFYKPSEVDMLIGADLFWDLVGPQKIKLGNLQQILCQTKLGWIISGPVGICKPFSLSSDIRCHFISTDSKTIDNEKDDIRTELTRFWQLEEIDVKSPHYSPEEKLCEDHFIKNTIRLDDGRFCVKIPLKQNANVLGNSIHKAKQCLLSLERRLRSKPHISKMYHEFMSEYKALGHMAEINHSDTNGTSYFMPHHGVLRENSATTKLRVVFNASCPTSTGVSFNDIQMVGPTVQDDLLSILLRFRQHKYVLSADVEKMYRQVVVHPSDRHLQQILWRDDIRDPFIIYQLNTVTYGTASAPFLATRCLKQIGLDYANSTAGRTNPTVGEIIVHDFYVDDLLTGCDDMNNLLIIRKELTDALASAGMFLRKWLSNELNLVSDTQNSSINLNIGSDEPNKLLGLGWQSSTDMLCFPTNLSGCSGNCKRDLLSAISRIFDPFGLLAPCVIVMKILMQSLWLQKLSWDEQLPCSIQKVWQGIVDKLHLINEIHIPRHVICDKYKKLQLHIFTDASERAYGACVYIRSINSDGKITVRLLLAKSRVAPIKPTTIPRLELCGALMGARLFEKVTNSLRLSFDEVHFWTDSTIVLGWLRMMPSKLQQFVRNRVAEILEKAGNHSWKHVPTTENPADLVSRGVDISALQALELWWNGPEYLKYDQSYWPSQPKYTEALPETRTEVALTVFTDTSGQLIDFKRFSKYMRLIRTVAYVLRFIRACKSKLVATDKHLKNNELGSALKVVIRQIQQESFPEYKLLLNKQDLPKKSALLKFNIILDEDNILRVGGRLENSEFSYEKRHPILIQSTHSFSKLLFDFEHIKLMHAGPQLLLASIREVYWPIGGRNLARACFYKCIRCSRMKGKIVNPIMGNLPHQRIVPGGYPFQDVGVDYAGPIMCASRQGRGCRLVKAYIAIFICFTTKAVHLESVGDLTSNCYLMALRRFIARRGKPNNIYSDNGTSFVGAYNDLSKILKANCHSLGERLASDNIEFHFIPAYTPHFGGLWEAGVKSTKYHLQRVLGNCNLTFEELNTTLTQIEAILNSRPLTPLSSDPADYNPLTPGHFLIGRPLTALPQPDFEHAKASHITRIHRIEQLRQHFWSRWTKEYIAELQLRTKWRSGASALKLDTLVVLKEDGLPPLKWKMGRIVAVHPGADGVARVAEVKTSSGIVRRAFNRICPLPVSSV